MTTVKSRFLQSSAYAGVLLCGLGNAALADKIEYYPISTDPNDWDVDRHPTTSFTLLGDYMGRTNVLALETVGADAGGTSYHQWEGYSQTTIVPPGDSFIGGDLYVADGWQNGSDTDYIRTSMWGSAMTDEEVATGNYNDNDAVFPIIQFTNRDGQGRLEVWDTNTSNGWVDLPETAGLINYAGWNTLDMRVMTNVDGQGGSAVQYFFNGELIYTWEPALSADSTSPEQFFAMYLKNRNHGQTDFTSYWSRLLTGVFLPEDINEIGNTPYDLAIINNNGPVTITQGAVLSGSVTSRGNAQTRQVLHFEPQTTVEGHFYAQNSQLNFQSGSGLPSTTFNSDLNLENRSATSGGSLENPIRIGGNLNVDRTSMAGGNLAVSGNANITGTIGAGNSIGTITVGGDLNLASSSFVEAEVDLSGNADLIAVGGVANLAGAVVVDTIDGYILNHDYVILTATGGLNGTFSSSDSLWNNIDNYAFVSPVLSYGPNTVFLTIERNGHSFANVAETPNQIAVANALETLGSLATPPALYSDIMLKMTVDDAPTSYNSLSGEIYASNQTVMIDQTRYIRDAVYGRLHQAFGGLSASSVEVMAYGPDDADITEASPTTDDVFGAWGYAYGGWSDYDGDSNTGPLKSSTGGFLAGIDGAIGDSWKVGVLAGYGYTSFDNKGPASGDTDAYTIGAYSGGEWPTGEASAFALRSGLSYTWNSVSADRVVSFPGFYDTMSSDYDAGAFQIFGELAYRTETAENTEVEPYANIAYVGLDADSFSETGTTAAALGVASQSTNSYFTTLGLRAAAAFEMMGQGGSEAYFDIGWRHAFGDIAPTSSAAFVGSAPFTVTGVPLAQDAALIGAGVDFALSEQATLGFGYTGQFGDGVSQNSINARLDVSF
ncbi:autotransporter domain-containing protein [Martelella mangrovi]|uniref:Outer membrane autotransporter protein n=1 Tax=Martelella mangrovi TaxID=1397477 RepID=A0ABV2IAQ1_9HYPH